VIFRLALVSALCSFALVPLATDHFFASSDGLYHVYRAMEVHRCLTSGVLVCRWMPDQFLGYGTPLLNLYSPGVYYVIAAFHLLGLGWIWATKATMAVFMVLSGIAAYGYATDFMSPRAALVASVVYVYVPYHLVNAYFRGDLPEFFAMAWFPAILWAFGRMVRPGPFRQWAPYFVAGAAAYAGLILCHNLSAFIYTGILALYCAFLLLRGMVEGQWGVVGALKPAALLLGSTLLSYGLSAYLAFPALGERHLIQLEGLLYVSHTDHFPALKDILPNRVIHIYGIIFPESPEYAYKMGLVQVALGAAGALMAAVFYRRFAFRARGEAVISVLVFTAAFFFSRPESLWFWDNIPLLPYAQFPWRFLLLMALPTSVLAGFLVDALSERWRAWVAPVLIVVTILTNTLGMRPIMANQVDGDIDLAESTRFELMYKLLGTTVAGEYIPRWVKEKPFVSPEALAIVLSEQSPAVHVPTSAPNVQVDRLEKGSNHRVYRATSSQGGRVVLNLAYFPGWKAWVDGAPAEIEITDPDGLVALALPPGERRIRLEFQNTAIRTAGEIVSAISIVVCIAMLVVAWRGAIRALRPPAFGPDFRRQTATIAAILALFPIAAWYYNTLYRPPPVSQRPLKINLSDTLMLIGFDMRVDGRQLGRIESVPPGADVVVSTYWQTLVDDQDRIARAKPYARLSNIDEQNWAFITETSRTNLDSRGSLFRSDMPLKIPSGMAPGVYQLDLGVFARDGRPMAVRNMELVELLPTQGSIRVGPVLVRKGADAVAQLPLPADANFEGKARLESFALQVGLSDRRSSPAAIDIEPGPLAEARAGDVMQVDLLWRSLRDNPGRFVVSTYLEDEQGFTWAVRDSEPVDNLYPSWMWRGGEPVRDQLRMSVPPETPPGRYSLKLKLLEGERPLSVVGPTGNAIGPVATLIPVQLERTDAQPREREVAIAERRRLRFNDDIEGFGYEIGKNVVTAGGTLDVQIAWRSLRDSRRDYAVKLSIVGRDGRSLGEVTAPVAGAQNPSSKWERGDIFRGQYRIRVGRSTPGGEARVVAELVDSATGAAQGRVELGRVNTERRESAADPGAAETTIDALFGAQIRLVGFGVKPGTRLRAGRDSSLNLTLLWRAERPIDRAYTVFTQLLGPDGKVAAQHDGEPDDGGSPTTGWEPGARIPDLHKIALPADLAPGEYRLIAGLYEAQGGMRLDLTDGQNFIELGRITLTR
jgi:hypothetical protein